MRARNPGNSRVCRVQPDVPAVARAFDYLVPPELSDAQSPGMLTVGTIVRVPLHGRRVRGWVLADDVESDVARAQLRPVRALVSAGPPPDVVALAQWAAWRWAGPVATFLRAASPPSIVAAGVAPEVDTALYPVLALPDAFAAVDAGGFSDAPVRVVTWPPGDDRRALVRAFLAPEGSTLIVVPEPGRAGGLVAAIASDGREVVHLHGGLSDRQRTDLWSEVRRGATVVVGGRASVWLPIPDLRAVVVIDDNDESLQDERAPTWHAREVALERARRVGASATLLSPTPSLDARVRAAIAIAPTPSRLRGGWPRLEIVDLRDEPQGMGLLSSGLGPALHRAVDGDGDASGRAICVVNRRGRARIIACRACRELTRCTTCGAAVGQPEHDLVCTRCGTTRPPVCEHCGATKFRALRPGVNAVRDEVAALVPRFEVAEVDAATGAIADASVLVGTEAVLHRASSRRPPPVRLVAFLAFDEELLAPRYRAHEQALWLLVRAARLLGERPAGGVLLVQTRVPEHDVLSVAASGDPAPFATVEGAIREATKFPPFGGLAELAGAGPAVAEAAAAVRAAGLTVLGGSDSRALVRADSAVDLADGLSAVDFSGARALGRLRVSVDPPRV